MKFAICNEVFRGWNLEDSFAFAAKTGYDAIEIAPFTIARRVTDISANQRQSVRDAAERAGIAISGIHWVLAQTEGLHLTDSNAAVRAETSRYLCSLVDFCADLGGEVLVFGSPQQRKIQDSVTPRDAWDWAAAAFRGPVSQAEQRAVTICFEPLSSAETNFVNTAAEAIQFVQPFGSPRFKIILDVKAMCAEPKPIPQIIRDSWPHFAYVHANDKNLKGPGFGNVDFKPIAATLKEVGYDGCVSVEVFNFDEGPEAIATRSLDYLKRVFA
jgi:sugar phosphate isomerase/epimerase